MADTNLISLLNKFTLSLEKQGKSKYTVIAYRKDIEQFIDFVEKKGVKTIDKVTKNTIEEFIQSLINSNYTKKSASRKLNSIRTFFKVLTQDGLIEKNTALEVAHPKFQHNEPRILTKLEYRALRDAAKSDIRTYAIVELLLQTGIKIGELAELTLDDIKEDHIIIRPYAKNPQREVPLNQAAKKAIEDYLAVRNGNAHTNKVFITRTGKPLLIRNIRQIINRCFQEVGIQNATVNDLRNTFIGHQLSAGASANYIAKIVGHRRLSSTERFLNVVKLDSEKRERLGEL